MNIRVVTFTEEQRKILYQMLAKANFCLEENDIVGYKEEMNELNSKIGEYIVIAFGKIQKIGTYEEVKDMALDAPQRFCFEIKPPDNTIYYI